VLAPADDPFTRSAFLNQTARTTCAHYVRLAVAHAFPLRNFQGATDGARGEFLKPSIAARRRLQQRRIGVPRPVLLKALPSEAIWSIARVGRRVKKRKFRLKPDNAIFGGIRNSSPFLEKAG
jgi:hypothetical protein